MNTDEKNIFRFTPKVKMAEAVSRYHSLLTILPRLGIPLGFGEKSVEQLCNENNVSLTLFMMIGKVYVQDNYHPDSEELAKCNIDDVVRYLLNSHKDYLDNKLPHIEHHLNALLANMHERYSKLIANFYSEFKNEVSNHFKYEEEVVFPYLKNIIDNKRRKINDKYGKNAFSKQHDDIEDTLRDLTNLLLKYIPADIAPTERIDMLMDMYSLAADIEKHATMEDRILVPYIKILESKKND